MLELLGLVITAVLIGGLMWVAYTSGYEAGHWDAVDAIRDHLRGWHG